MLSYLPFKPIKHQTFTLYFDTHAFRGNINLYGTIEYPVASSSFTWTISKDGGAFATPTNAVTNIGGVAASLVLTSTEMNCNTLVLHGTYQFNQGMGNAEGGGEIVVVVYTSRLGSFDLDMSVEDVGSISSSNPTLQEILSVIWQMLTKGGKRDSWSLNKLLGKWNGKV
jgi:hypothetical protein